jgi:hypothetical protein
VEAEAGMARIAGRSNWVAWPAGMLCLAVVAALGWLSLPMIPGAVQWAGDALRSATSRSDEDVSNPAPFRAATVPACRALYTSALWSELTARSGADPAEDASPPPVSATGVVAALAPVVRETCTWTAASTGSIVTTLADIDTRTAPLAGEALSSQGFSCGSSGGGLRCTRTDGDVAEDVIVRDGVWLSSRLDGWHPNLYTERIAERLWPQ